MLLQRRNDLLGHVQHGPTQPLRDSLDEVVDEEGNVIEPFAQRRDANREDVQAIEEVGTERAAFHEILEILVRGGNHAHVDCVRTATAPQPFDLVFLQRAQQLGLQFERQITNLVEEQRAAVGGLKPAVRPRDGTREGVNLEETRKLAQAVKIPVIASGGVATLNDLRDLLSLERDGVEGVIVGKALYAGAFTLRQGQSEARSSA